MAPNPNRPTPTERAALRSAHENLKTAHEALKAAFERTHADEVAHASTSQIASDRNAVQADRQAFEVARAQWKQTLDAFFAAHPGARERWEQRHARQESMRGGLQNQGQHQGQAQ